MNREQKLEQALRGLIKIASGVIEHDRAGQCPDAVEGHDARDADCAACKAVMRAERLLSEPAQAEQSERELPDYLKDALDNLVHDNYERSQAGSRNRQADADLIRAALATLPAQAEQPEQQPAYVECRECIDCGHVGINDAHPTDAKCAMCDWSGPSPVEDQCPDCGKENVMGAACPKCSGRYRILAETHVAAPIAPAPQQSGLVEWVVGRWRAEVANRPLVNVHRRTLDDTWRQVLRRLGEDDVALLGPRHDALTQGGSDE